jgi:hypothetical protein
MHLLLDRREPGSNLARLELLARADEAEAPALIERWAREATDEGLPSCTLDLIEASGRIDLDTLGTLLGLSRERVRQIEEEALARLGLEAEGLRDALADDGNDGQGGGWNGGSL